MANVFLTGAAGYIGSVVSRYLVSRNHQVTGVDLLLHGGHGLAGLWGLHPNFRFVRADIRDGEAMRTLLTNTRPDVVINLAAIVGDHACRMWPDDARQTNLTASKQLINLC